MGTKLVVGIDDILEMDVNPLNVGMEKAIGCYHASIQELIVIDDLLSALVGIEGRYTSIKRVRGKDANFAFQVDASMDLALQFVESRSQFKTGLVNHAFAAALRALLLDYVVMVAQLEHQFRLGRLSIQGLWFYCQPMMGSLQALSIVIKKASANNFVGSAILNLLQSQAKAMAGDRAVRLLLEKMTQSASSAYLGILERWVYEGVIDDPYGELFIAENKSLPKESLTQDYDAKYWRQRYSLKEDIPSFLENAAGTILTTGKYLNVMRECGHNVQVSVSENSKLMSFGANHHYLECIKAAYEFASGELLNLIKEKYDLMGKLRSIKHYLLLDQLHSKKRNRLEQQRLNDLVYVKYNRTLRFRYDMRNTLDPISLQNIDESNEWLLGRMDGESDEDNKPVFDDDDGLTWATVARASGVEESSHASRATSSRSKAQPRISKPSTLTPLQLIDEEEAGSDDTEEEDVEGYKSTDGEEDDTRDELLKKPDEISVEKLQSLLDLALRTTAAAADPCHEDLICCVERSTLIKSLSMLKDLQINRAVSDSSDLEEPVSITGLETFSLSYKVQWPLSLVISRKALTKYQLIFRFLFHCKHVDRQLCGAWQIHQVLEPNWHVMHNRLQTAKSIDDKVERLKSICLQYAAATQWLISSSIDIPKLDTTSSEKFKQMKIRKPSSSQALKLATENAAVTDSVLKFEREFNSELESLGPILSSSSQAEPYLTHLAQWILSVGRDQ
ncbi:hypothetical protein HYC85_018214 [Camellia sinensis]|uniref:Gamma-tubulin complex component n=1 Tax=Camellia sinensis TaxID=4442 RepID=A0A7J7GUL4_CAMSI|nr:hypothetical protein HYC85_018214 [Camellia sinensis]